MIKVFVRHQPNQLIGVVGDDIAIHLAFAERRRETVEALRGGHRHLLSKPMPLLKEGELGVIFNNHASKYFSKNSCFLRNFDSYEWARRSDDECKIFHEKWDITEVIQQDYHEWFQDWASGREKDNEVKRTLYISNKRGLHVERMDNGRGFLFISGEIENTVIRIEKPWDEMLEIVRQIEADGIWRMKL